MKKSSDTIGNRTRDLLACSAVPQPTAPPRAPTPLSTVHKYRISGEISYVYPQSTSRKCKQQLPPKRL